MIKIDFENYTQIFAKMAKEIEGKKLSQKEKIWWLLERGYGISCLFVYFKPLNFGGYLSGVIRDLRKEGKQIGTFKAAGEKSQTYFLLLDENTPIISNEANGQTAFFDRKTVGLAV